MKQNPALPLPRFFAIGMLMLTAVHPAGVEAAAPEKLSPFTKVVCGDNAVMVVFEGLARHLVSINDQPVESILEFCRRTYGTRWEKRFVEDLPQVLEAMGYPVSAGKTVKLTLRNLETGENSTIVEALMTGENRKIIMRSRDQTARGGVVSDEARNFPAVLNVFEEALREQWSYYKLSAAAPLRESVQSLRERLSGLGRNEFGIELQKIIAMGVDGHAAVSGYQLPGGYLPFLIECSGSRLVAFKEDRSGFLDAEYPYITRIDGREMREWLGEASRFVVKGSPQYIRWHSLRTLRSVGYLRGMLGVPGGSDLVLELASADGRSKKEVRRKVSDRLPVYGKWPASASRVLEGNIGYLRLPAMDGTASAEIREWLPQFRETRGLVIDVRGNGGGSRDALRLLYSCLSRQDEPPRVTNAAVYRRARQFSADHLEARFMHPETAAVWSAAERAAIIRFKSRFAPEWTPPPAEFSEWHYLVLTRANGEGIFTYTRPVAVLSDEKCFSATDILLSALKGLPQVTILGSASGGGSARAVTVPLTESLSVRLGSMLSFQADGRLFDGNGVAPDITIQPGPGYFIGRDDNVLAAALELLNRKAKQ